MKQYILVEKIERYKVKTCSKCKIIFPSTNVYFNKCNKVKSGLTAKCKTCINLYNVENKEKISIKNKIYYEENKSFFQQKQRNYNKQNKDKKRESGRKYRSKNKELINTKKRNYNSKKRQENALFKSKENIRNLIKSSIKRKGFSKKTKTYQILGCTFEEFKIYIENQFLPWMNWNNYGKYNGELNFGWDFDHIIPNSSAMTEEEVIKLNHYTNFQPLCSKTNRDIKINF